MVRLLPALAVSALLLSVPALAADPPPVLTYKDLQARPKVTGGVRVAYGKDAQQFGDLWLPAGAGPHPVLVLIHGGCWLGDVPAFELMNPMAKALSDAGIAVWNIEYRRLGQAGGGYPGTFQDVSAAMEQVRTLAGPHKLDLTRVAVAGHSAGGHLAVWAAGRALLPKGSPLYKADALPVTGVVSLAGIVDLRDYRARGPAACGGPETVDKLIGAATRGEAAFADTSPGEAPAKSLSLTLVSGTRDIIVPPTFAQAYGAKALGPGLRELEIDGAGHFELIDPQSGAWPVIQAEIRDRLRR
ncbi:MAG: alpha/beta fold hydrolase [Niveispirillum sp.]|uniref:alpha/beta fold hydrolase n=1 Tax=Niveispirillum sp. TaxID=1917217 RepID=UPI0040360B69